MAGLKGREHRFLDLSKVRDARYKGAGIHVNESNWGRCTAALCEWIAEANTTRGGTSPFPFGIYFFEGDVAAIQDPPPELAAGPFLELIPCDRPDRRAAKLSWNEAGSEAGFGFAPLATLLGIETPRGATLWIDAMAVNDTEGKPVMTLPVGDRIQRRAVQESAASRQKSTEG